MATFVRIALSGSTNGEPIPITATSTATQTIHTAHATDQDEIYLWASNVHASAAGNLTIEIDAATSAGQKFTFFSVPANTGLVCVLPGATTLTGSKLCTIFADASGKFVITGWVNRITA